MKDASANNSAERGPLTASGPTASPSWNILKKCLLVAGAAVVIMVVLAFIFTDVQGVLSVLFGALLVIVFFGLSLLVGHIVGKKMPSAVMGVFVMTYFVKVVGFAAVLYAMGTPGWLNKPWFAGAAVATVLLWQATEVVNFTKQRFLVFDESAAQAPTAGGTAADGEKKGTLP
ncbi:ATP synthase protein I [Arthrobacter alpinus]|uniref:ATP synthase protein I n=1 Tax=Arthrobacter alpinus TaxID=656366 RepID=A0A1H5EQG4_9MICC|nr:hypothetical protein [Arthrobacter alpinus]SED93346.1 ATP synthase protein I [Arthrobacter alpinus]